MITVKVVTADGNHWTTEINCSYQEAKQYYMDKIFNDSREQPQRVIAVEWLDAPMLTQTEAEVIKGLLANAGWLDDADELIADEYDDCGLAGVTNTVKTTQNLIDKVNMFLPESEQITVDLGSELAAVIHGR